MQNGSVFLGFALLYYSWGFVKGVNKESQIISVATIGCLSVLLWNEFSGGHTQHTAPCITHMISWCVDSVLFSYIMLHNSVVLVVGVVSSSLGVGVHVAPALLDEVQPGVMLRYQATERTWHCGSNDFENHASGMSTSLFFPHTSLDRINDCCHAHDMDYCCQVGRVVADELFYSCLAVHCRESYCPHVIASYKFLLDGLGGTAYERAAHDVDDCARHGCPNPPADNDYENDTGVGAAVQS
jgi:hypothetical protein